MDKVLRMVLQVLEIIVYQMIKHYDMGQAPNLLNDIEYELDCMEEADK